MTKSVVVVGVHEAKTHLSRLLQRVEAQARSLDASIMTADAAFEEYDVELIRVG